MYTSLTTKPGEFKARCRMPRWVADVEVLAMDPPLEGAYPQRWNHKLERGEMKIPCAFETTDRAAFDEHARLHAEDRGDRRHLMKLHQLPIPLPVKMWTGPRLKPEGLPIDTAKLGLEQCPHCGLYGEGGRLWWDEHLRGCALAAAS